MPNLQGLLGRRTFLSLAAGAAAWAGALPAMLRPLPEPPAGAGLALAFKHRESAMAVGRRYLSRYPEDVRPRLLARDLRRAGAGDPATARSALRAQVRRDFERGDTVLLDGWILARSECQACAALALAAGGAQLAELVEDDPEAADREGEQQQEHRLHERARGENDGR